MPKKKPEASVVEIEVGTPEGMVRVELRDESERDVHDVLIVDPLDRDRVYQRGDLSYTASCQNADGAWIYRKETQ